MLIPAIVYKDEIELEFAKRLYTDEFFYYSGYGSCNELPDIRAEDGVYQYAIVGSSGNLLGYLAYAIDLSADCVSNFGLFSFQRGNYMVGKDLYEKMEELVKQHHRIEWRMISGNPVQKHYDKFCYKHGGNKVILHDVCKDNKGKYHDEHIYEIVK